MTSRRWTLKRPRPNPAPRLSTTTTARSAPPANPRSTRPPRTSASTDSSTPSRRSSDRSTSSSSRFTAGTEEPHDPTPRTIKALRAAADAGADLVIGNHPHWAQAVEERGNAFIAYALGNFIFDQVQTEEHTEGYLVEATFWGGRLVNVRLRPYYIVNRTTPTFATGATRTKILDDVFTASANLPTETP